MPEQVIEALMPTPLVTSRPCPDSLGGQHMYDIKRSVPYVATTVCYDLYSPCLYPMQIWHISKIRDGENYNLYSLLCSLM